LVKNYAQCALERKIPIMDPLWVEEAYDIWLRGDDVDLGQVSARPVSAVLDYLLIPEY